MKSIAIRIAAACLVTSTVALAPSVAVAADPAEDISGTWAATFDSQVGEQSYTYTFSVDGGGTLTGHSASNIGESDLTGNVDGNTVTFVENLTYQGIALVITYTGTIVSADEISFSRDVGGQGGETFTATRQ
jgi:hypothetical protein